MSIYTHYRNRLVEISGKSRSLYSKNVAKKQAYNLGRIFENNSDEAVKFIEFLFSDSKQRFKLFNNKQINDFVANNLILSKNQKKAIEIEIESLKALQREIDNIEKETGRYELFVGYPFVEGGIGQNTLVKAPLLLFSAKIVTENGVELEINRGEPLLLNKVLLFAIAKENKINIEGLNTEFEDYVEFKDINVLKEYLNTFKIALKHPKQRLVLNMEKLKELPATNELEIRNYLILGRFPLANSIYNDYTLMEKNRLSSPAIDVLIKNKNSRADHKARGKKTDCYPIAQLDYAQELSIEQVNKFSNVVIYGPPGTGKSQTITNMITDAICKNKRVLVVSQKRTALDVVFNRLGELNSKAMILPDPEKSKNEFYERVRLRYAQATSYKNRYSPEVMAEIERNLNAELNDLQILSDSFFTTLPFGLSLQQMYIKSARLDKNPPDMKIFKAMQSSRLIDLNYHDIAEALKSINQKNKAELYYNHYLFAKNNPVIDYIRTDLDLDKLNQIKIYINKFLSEESLPFNLDEYEYSRYMMVYNLENNAGNLRPLADMIARLQNPSLYGWLRASAYVPLLWVAYPVFKSKSLIKRRRILNKLKIAQLAVRRYVSEFDLLKTVLEPKGFAMVVDNITFGNAKFLAKLLAALDDYIALKDIILSLKSLSENEKNILDFAFNHSENKKDFMAILSSIMPLRIYHEVVAEEKRLQTHLAKTIVYSDIKKRINSLKAEKLQITRMLAMDKFNDDFKARLQSNDEEGKNFHYQIDKQNNKLWAIRDLMQAFEGYLFDLFPCWLLSPEAVSSILPLKPDLFDIVLFDEASQIFIESCIPAIYRSKRLVVSGDNKQLRPTNVFVKRYMGDDTYNGDMSLSMQAAMEVESLLDLASTRLQPSSLTYHYRSKYEELINFSNYAFYNGTLQIAPNISRFSNYRPIERVMVDGKWAERKNLPEAKAVANLVEKIFATRTNNETIGIVTFNSDQEECIHQALDAKCAKDAAFKTAFLAEQNRHEKGEYMGLFVKNLENVQGDERDIIIFSVGYAKNEEGKVNSQFGTLSLSGGENRLNVAITRAKEKIYVVTSVEPEEFASVDSSKNAGPKLFKKYLQYARAVSNRNTKEVKLILESLCTSLPTAASAAHVEGEGIIEKELKIELEKLGYSVDLNLGNAQYKISLGIYDQALERYVLGIECDYNAKNSSDALIERDVYRINFLESKGWKIMRVWSRDFWLNKPALIKAIEKEISDSRFKIMEQSGAIKPKTKEQTAQAKNPLKPKKPQNINKN